MSAYRPLVVETPEQIRIRELEEECQTLRDILRDHSAIVFAMRRDHDREVASLRHQDRLMILVFAVAASVFAAHAFLAAVLP